MSQAAFPGSNVAHGRKTRTRRGPAFVLALGTFVALLTGCSTAGNGDTGSPGKPLQLRLVISSVDGPCTAPALTSAGPATACDRSGTITYELGKSLGTVTPTSVALPEDPRSADSVLIELNEGDSGTLAEATRKALNTNLAIVLDGRVFSAPRVMEAVTTSQMALAFGSAAEAEKVAAEMTATAAP